MTIEKLDYPRGIVLDVNISLREQIVQIRMAHLRDAQALPSGRYPVGIPETKCTLRVEHEGNALYLKPKKAGEERSPYKHHKATGLPKSLRRFTVTRIPEDQDSVSVTAMVITSGYEAKEPELRLYEDYFYTPGLSPERR